MSAKANALASYGKVANAESDPLQQIVMLYEGAIKFLRLAAHNIESGDLVAKAAHTNRALDIIVYLQSILDAEHGGDVATVLDHLYRNVAAITLRASARLDGAGMLRAASLLAPVRDAWVSAATGGVMSIKSALQTPPAPPNGTARPPQFQASV